ncbi:hypothetical protein F4604DRAFT_3264 [Suillus subluteus]|nr:hypothetical protein F4604DRAFT_3264 [Suillus subluteus]
MISVVSQLSPSALPTWSEDTADDEWTTRSWMFHDLLVPTKIRFFNKHWIPLKDHKSDEEPCIESNTLEILMRAALPTQVISMSVRCRCAHDVGSLTQNKKGWRCSISPMGNFGVSLKTAYGEAGNRAFRKSAEAYHAGG